MPNWWLKPKWRSISSSPPVDTSILRAAARYIAGRQAFREQRKILRMAFDVTTALAIVAFATWLYLICARGLFWLGTINNTQQPPAPKRWPACDSGDSCRPQ